MTCRHDYEVRDRWDSPNSQGLRFVSLRCTKCGFTSTVEWSTR